MDNLYIDSSSGIVLGKKLLEDSDNLKNLLISYNKIQEKLNNISDDAIYEKYVKQLSIDTKIMCKLSEAVEKTGDVLVNISSVYNKLTENSEEENYNE